MPTRLFSKCKANVSERAREGRVPWLPGSHVDSLAAVLHSAASPPKRARGGVQPNDQNVANCASCAAANCHAICRKLRSALQCLASTIITSHVGDSLLEARSRVHASPRTHASSFPANALLRHSPESQDVHKWFHNREHKKKNVGAGLATGGTVRRVCRQHGGRGGERCGASRKCWCFTCGANVICHTAARERAAGASGTGPRNAEVPWTREEDEITLSEGAATVPAPAPGSIWATRHGRDRISEDLAQPERAGPSPVAPALRAPAGVRGRHTNVRSDAGSN